MVKACDLLFHNSKMNKFKRIDKNDNIPEGWKKGRGKFKK